MDDEVKVAILEQKQEVLEQFVGKLDSAIEKIAEVNTNVSKMLAVHEEKISKIDELRDKMDGDHDIIRARLSVLERRVWTAIGALGAVVVISNPQAIKPLFNSADSAIIQPVVAFVNGSR